MSRISLYDAQHPSRQKAIAILEFIAESIGKPTIFDGELWYELEDRLTEIINGK